jgi:hypothetical protein
MRLARRWSVWLCLALMVWAAAAESTHNHPTATDAASCSICVAAHSTRPTSTSNHTAPVFAAVGLVQEKEVLFKARLDVFDLGIRGPPSIA